MRMAETYRVQFHNYAKSLFATHPVIGIGTGGFKYSFSKDNPVPAWGKELTDPHSQYWLTLSEQGIIGLLFLLFLNLSLMSMSFISLMNLMMSLVFIILFLSFV